MSAKEVLDKLRDHDMTDILSGEGKSVYSSFASSMGLTKLSDIIDMFSFKEDDEKWQELYAKKRPQAEIDKMRGPRLRIAFLSSGLRDLKSFYLSGNDNHVITDVDVLREAPHYYWNNKARIGGIKTRLKD